MSLQSRGQDFSRTPKRPAPQPGSLPRLEGPESAGPGPPSALISAASSSSVRPPRARRPTPCAASAHALCRHQHVHGTASHQGHQALPSPLRKKALQSMTLPHHRQEKGNSTKSHWQLTAGLRERHVWNHHPWFVPVGAGALRSSDSSVKRPVSRAPQAQPVEGPDSLLKGQLRDLSSPNRFLGGLCYPRRRSSW